MRSDRSCMIYDARSSFGVNHIWHTFYPCRQTPDDEKHTILHREVVRNRLAWMTATDSLLSALMEVWLRGICLVYYALLCFCALLFSSFALIQNLSSFQTSPQAALPIQYAFRILSSIYLQNRSQRALSKMYYTLYYLYTLWFELLMVFLLLFPYTSYCVSIVLLSKTTTFQELEPSRKSVKSPCPGQAKSGRKITLLMVSSTTFLSPSPPSVAARLSETVYGRHELSITFRCPVRHARYP